MSMFKVPLTKIVAINTHPNADRLELATVYGFQVVVGKGQYKVGDPVIYVPVDSILPKYIEDKLFPEGSKITLHNSRVRQIKIRSVYSQGMLFSPAEFGVDSKSFEQDFAEILGITKYEPPAPKWQQVEQAAPGERKRRNKANPAFHKYGGLDNIKWMPHYFAPTEMVQVTEKLHGTSARCGKVPTIPRNIFHRLGIFLGLCGKYEFVYGSNNVDISGNKGYKGWYGQDVYGQCLSKTHVEERIEDGVIVYGEIIGPGIQKNYDYGLKEHKFVVFDVKKDGEFMSPAEAQAYCTEVLQLPYVPVLYVGVYDTEVIGQWLTGPSVYDPNTPVKEGLAIKSLEGYAVKGGGKRALKMINPEYLNDKGNTDFH